VEVRQPRRRVRRDAQPRRRAQRPRGAVGEGAVEGAAGHERVDEAGLLPAVVPRQAEGHERDEVRVPVAAQDRHLPQRLPQALLRVLPRPKRATHKN
jgi:hypothetical protein